MAMVLAVAIGLGAWICCVLTVMILDCCGCKECLTSRWSHATNHEAILERVMNNEPISNRQRYNGTAGTAGVTASDYQYSVRSQQVDLHLEPTPKLPPIYTVNSPPTVVMAVSADSDAVCTEGISPTTGWEESVGTEGSLTTGGINGY